MPFRDNVNGKRLNGYPVICITGRSGSLTSNGSPSHF
ncbi:Probable NADH-ubiquinone oxidoreductase B18 subunit, putative [Brugia malayi]|uniref:Bm3044, isoform b n=1 Tax=Brugia malayi TaxID=6279 RepID=A0A0K0J8J5_BRUMA|nr:putative NADH-ubiquinone oxidoreductase B18 subunit, putative [Brugia malayi]CDQ02728.1 Bm3044, isoform b [Brugia malayi]VIO96722.1 Probable NADH-ubiquinone oxidoreductase B18 subunit, putative [Brugia malayi]